MTINWKSILPYVIPTLLLLVAIHNSPQVQNFLYDETDENDNSFINLQKTRGIYLSEIVDEKFLSVNAKQSDTLIKFDIYPKQLVYGEQGSIALFIDGVNEYRNIKVLITDQNNIVRFADDKTAKYIDNNIDNKSIFSTNSNQISIKKKTIINFNILPSNYEIIDGVWKINIIILKENNDISLFISKEISIENESNGLNNQIVLFIMIPFLIIYLTYQILSMYRYIYK